MVLDPMYFLIVGPAFLLAMIASAWVKSAFSRGQSVETPMSGAEMARRILESQGLFNVPVEEIEGQLSDHYDPSARVLRLSSAVYHGRNASAVGVAAHEAGHALQHAQGYWPLVIRNMAVPMAGFGSNCGILLFLAGLAFSFKPLILAGIILFSCVVFFQVVNLPVEINASRRACREIAGAGIFTVDAERRVRKVLTAAAMTYVAATLQAILTLVYLLIRSRND